MSRYLILLLLLLMSACTTSHQEGSTPLAQTPSASVASPSGTPVETPSATLLPAQLVASLSVHPSRIYSAPGEKTTFEVTLRNMGSTASTFPLEVELPVSAWRINPPSLSTTLPPVFLEPGSEYSGEVELYTPASDIGREYLIEVSTFNESDTLRASLQVIIVSQNGLCAYELAQITRDNLPLSSAAADLGSVIMRFEEDVRQNPDELPGNLVLREELLTAIDTLKQELAPYSDLRAFRVLKNTTDEFIDLLNINIYGQLPLLCRDLRTIGIYIEEINSEATPTTESSATEVSLLTATAEATTTPTLVPSATPTQEPPSLVLTPGFAPPHEAPMVVVPAGEFLMGSTIDQVEAWGSQWGEYVNGLSRCESPKCGNSKGMSNELYQLTAYLEEFEIDQFEVTNYQYRQCVEVDVCGNPKGLDTLYLPKFANYPITNITQQKAATYCEWVGKRLPSEAEWEKAARGTDGRIYPWGNEWDESLTIYYSLLPVGNYPQSPYGAFDMVGNAAEWTSDVLAPYPGYKFPTGAEMAVGAPVYRGGSIQYFPALPEILLRTAIRNDFRERDYEVPFSKDLGFRCARGEEQELTVLSSTAPAPLATQTVVDLSDMVLIPAGEFIMGTDQPDLSEYEKPAHTVYLDAFYIDKYEVTAAQYADFLNVLGDNKWACQGTFCTRSEYVGKEEGVYKVRYQGEQVPIQATWHGALTYCQWLGKRLPTEAEWEKAARGTDGRKYPWGNEEISREAIGDWDLPEAVGTHPVDLSPYGVFDMFGNAREWTQDWYDESYYTYSPSNNPTGPEGPVGYGDKSVRSGLPSHYQITDRDRWRVDAGNGFRCAISQ